MQACQYGMHLADANSPLPMRPKLWARAAGVLSALRCSLLCVFTKAQLLGLNDKRVQP